MGLKVVVFDRITDSWIDDKQAWAAAREKAIKTIRVEEPLWYQVCWYLRPEDLLEAAEGEKRAFTIDGLAEELFMVYEPFEEPDTSKAEAIGRRMLEQQGVPGMNSLRDMMMLTRGPHFFNGLNHAWRQIEPWYWQ